MLAAIAAAVAAGKMVFFRQNNIAIAIIIKILVLVKLLLHGPVLASSSILHLSPLPAFVVAMKNRGNGYGCSAQYQVPRNVF